MKEAWCQLAFLVLSFQPHHMASFEQVQSVETLTTDCDTHRKALVQLKVGWLVSPITVLFCYIFLFVSEFLFETHHLFIFIFQLFLKLLSLLFKSLFFVHPSFFLLISFD